MMNVSTAPGPHQPHPTRIEQPLTITKPEIEQQVRQANWETNARRRADHAQREILLQQIHTRAKTA